MKGIQVTRRLSVGAVIATLVVANTMQAHSLDEQKKPQTPAEKGRVLYVNNCAVCHGSNAAGDEGPSLHGLSQTQAQIVAIISKGFDGQMPSFKKKLKKAEMTQIATYIKTLKK